MRSRNRAEAERAAEARTGIDVNAIVSFDLRFIRQLRGFTQDQVARKLGALTGHQLPQASISAMERGFDGERRRRFDAHELDLLSLVLEVQIAYIFIPPIDCSREGLTDSRKPVNTLISSLLGTDEALARLTERLSDVVGCLAPDLSAAVRSGWEQ